MANGNYSQSGGYRSDSSRNERDLNPSSREFGSGERDHDRRFSSDPIGSGERSYDDRHQVHENGNNYDVRSSHAGYGDPRFGSGEQSKSWARDSFRGDYERGRQRPEYRFGERNAYGAGTAYSDDLRRSYEDQNLGEKRSFMDRAGDEVASWFGDDAARERRAIDEHRGKGPRGYKRSDARIEEDINDRLSDDPMLDATNISVSVKDAEVTLDGTVASRWDKRRAEDVVEDVSGVGHVQNNLRVGTAGTDSLAGSTTI